MPENLLAAAGETPWERERLLESLEAYQRGLSDAPLLRKWRGGSPANPTDAANPPATAASRQSVPLAASPDAGSPPAAAAPEAAMTFVVSTEEADRHGDIVAAAGWQLTAYRQNPVFLWAHDYTRPVIGRAAAVWPEPGALLARMEFAPTDFAREVAALYRSGYQQGVSVGFKPLRYAERRHEQTGAFLGIHFLEQELLEISAVPVPANRQALRRAMEQAPRLGDYLARAADFPDPDGVSPGLAEILAQVRAGL